MAYSGYKIYEYRDVNPQSSTFNTIRRDRIQDAECSSGGARYEEISSYCELDSNGNNSGYLIHVKQDVNIDSPTYGQTIETREQNLLACPLQSTDADWVIDDSEGNGYCEEIEFPSGLKGNSGVFIVQLVDDNDASPTYQQTRIERVVESGWNADYQAVFGRDFPCEAVDMRPQIEEVSSSCVLVECSGRTTTNGYKTVVGIDKNPYSMTYLQTVTATVEDGVKCPNNCSDAPTPTPTYVFTFSDGTTSKTLNTDATSSSITLNVISTVDGISKAYTASEACDFITVSTNGNTVTITQTENMTSDIRSCEIRFVQETSGKVILLTIMQGASAEDEYVFMIQGVGKSESISVESGTSTVSRSIISTKNGNEIPFTINESCSWLSSVKNGNIVTTDIDENEDTDPRSCTVTLTQSETQDTITITFVQAASSDEKILFTDFDYLTFTFNWGENDGQDLDTATYVLGSNIPIKNNRTLDECPVGFSCRGSDATYGPIVEQYLEHGGDNTQSGDECALVNWKTISDAAQQGSQLSCKLFGNWFRQRSDGNCSVTFKTYKGEGMIHGSIDSSYIFIPSGNTELVQEKTVSGNVRAFSSSNTDDIENNYSLIATFEYDTATKNALMTNNMLTPSGRELRHYGVIDGQSVEGNNSTILGEKSITYTRVGKQASIACVMYNKINGVNEYPSSYSASVRTTTVGEVVEEFCTATMSGSTLNLNVLENTSGIVRTCRVTVTATFNSADVTYIFIITQNA